MGIDWYVAMKLRTRLLVGYGTPLGLILVVVAWALVNLLQLGKASDAILRENYRSILAAENMIDAIERQDSAILLIMLGFDLEGLEQFRASESGFLQWLGRAKDNITIDGEEQVLAAIEARYERYLVEFTSLRDRKFIDDQEAGRFYYDTVLPVFLSVRDQALNLREMNQQTMYSASSQAGEVSSRAVWSTIVVAIVAVFIGAGFSLVLSKRLAEPVRKLMSATERLTQGDYEIEVEVEGTDEVTRLVRAFNEMSRKLGSYHKMNMQRMVAEQRRSEAVLQSIDDGIVVVDSENKVVNLNKQAAFALGIHTRDALGSHILEILPSEEIFALIKASTEANESPDGKYKTQEFTTQCEGRTYHFECAVTPVQSDSETILGVVLLLRDITRRKQIDEMKSSFLMTASHELKTPLQSLGMSIELLREQSSDENDKGQKDLLEAASEEVARLKSLVSDLLDLSRIESGRMELELDVVPVRTVVEKAVSLLEAQAEERKIELAVVVPDEKTVIQADPNKVVWVLTNLIGNAVRYAKSRIEIRARAHGDWAHIEVRDDGQGIPPEHQSRIFEKFVQVPGRESAGGTGLGLAICREIVRAHGGTIWVDSQLGEGSSFTFTLPVTRRKEESRS